MPKYIDTYGGSARGALNDLFGAIAQAVSFEPVALGEEHSTPYARALIADLAEQHLIHTLFSEQRNDLMAEGGKSIQDYLHANRGKKGDRAALGPYYQFLVAGDSKGGRSGKFTYPEFLSVLLDFEVRVFCYDINPEPQKRRVKLGTALNMQKRNLAMARTFENAGARRQRGVILLNGAMHFKAFQDETGTCNSLDVLCGIPKTARFLLPKLLP